MSLAPTGGLFDVDALKRRLIREKPQSFAAPVAREHTLEKNHQPTKELLAQDW